MKLIPRNVFPEKDGLYVVQAQSGWLSLLYFQDRKWYLKCPSVGADNMSEVHPEKEFNWLKDIHDHSISYIDEANKYL